MANLDTSAVSELDAETIAETFQKYQKPIIGAVIVLAAAGGGFWMWRSSAQIRETRAGQAYQVAEGAFASGNMPAAKVELEKITGRYAGTAAGTQASMLLAQLLFDEGKFDDGLKVLQAAAGKAPESLVAGLQGLIAAGYEGAGKAAEAAAAYEAAASRAQFAVDRDQYRMERARVLVGSGDAATAKAIYEEIGGRDDSPFAGEAKVRLGEIAAKQ